MFSSIRVLTQFLKKLIHSLLLQYCLNILREKKIEMIAFVEFLTIKYKITLGLQNLHNVALLKKNKLPMIQFCLSYFGGNIF